MAFWCLKKTMTNQALFGNYFVCELLLLFFISFIFSWLLLWPRKNKWETVRFKCRHKHIHRIQSNINFSHSMVWFILCECACQFCFFFSPDNAFFRIIIEIVAISLCNILNWPKSNWLWNFFFLSPSPRSLPFFLFIFCLCHYRYWLSCLCCLCICGTPTSIFH